jgi:hypothetical protein
VHAVIILIDSDNRSARAKKIVRVAESMDNEDREREGYQNDEPSHSLSQEGYHRSLSGDETS